MKTKTFLSASRLAVMALACIFSFTACGGDDEEPTVDELLSEETTPITFDLTKRGAHFLFDYAGSSLVGSDTIEIEYNFQKSQTIDLRQGKHRLLWLRGLSKSQDIWDRERFYACPYYDIKSGTVKVLDDDYWLALDYPLPQYAVKEIEVTPYLMPEQKIEYQLLCAQIYISFSCDIPTDDDVSLSVYGIPFVKEVGIEDNRYTMGNANNEAVHATTFQGAQGRYNLALFSKNILCPKGGIDNVQLRYEVTRNGSVIYSASLPVISLQRGHETTISGPLIDGEMADFTVETKTYDGN